MKYVTGTVCCIGTGPSLTLAQVEVARAKGFTLFGCNRVWEIVPDLTVLWGTNLAFWQHYWCDRLAQYPAEKWTVSGEAARLYRLQWVGERNAPGLSTDWRAIHHGHGGGYSMLNLAYLMGAQRVVLLGYDLSYARDYDGREHRAGSTPRHYFGEYPAALQHWPSVKVREGRHLELLALYQSVAEQGLIEIINCTGPTSALACFPSMTIADERV